MTGNGAAGANASTFGPGGGGGRSFTNGAAGGSGGISPLSGNGGFGGGGGGGGEVGGGGGSSELLGLGGDGGTSFDAGSNQLFSIATSLGNGSVTITELSATVPEPGSLALLGTGLASLIALLRRRRRA